MNSSKNSDTPTDLVGYVRPSFTATMTRTELYKAIVNTPLINRPLVTRIDLGIVAPLQVNKQAGSFIIHDHMHPKWVLHHAFLGL